MKPPKIRQLFPPIKKSEGHYRVIKRHASSPCSIDPAESTYEKGINMNTKLLQVRYLVPIIAGLLYACSGGDINISAQGPTVPPFPQNPPSGSEAITAHGAITGSAGLNINGVQYSTSGANVTVNDQPGTLSDLTRGMIVTVTGRINSGGQSGTADQIRFEASLIGPVESLDPGNGRLTAMGQTVAADPDTVFGAGIDPATFGGLSAGNIVQVSGFADAGGTIRASRIERVATTNELQLVGRVAGLDLANLLFRINWLTLDYGSAIVIDLPGGAPADGMMVKAVGSMAGGLFRIERLAAAQSPTGNIGRRVQAAGIITRFDSPGDFDINHSPATAGAGTAYQNGNAGDLGVNATIVIDGDFSSGGRIAANRITFGRLLGDTVTLDFGFSNFTEIYVPAVFGVTVTQGPEYSVKVTVDKEAADRIDVTQTGSRLTVTLAIGNGSIETLQADITMPVLEKIELAGVAQATLNGFDQAQMTINVGGVSRLQGHASRIGNLTANVSGVSQLALGDIRPIGFANIHVSGVSRATLNMDVGSTLTGSVATGQGTGTSTLFYYGTNVAVNVATDSRSSLVWLGGTRP